MSGRMTPGRLLRLVLSAPVRLSTAGMRCGPHITRYAMYTRLQKVFADIVIRPDAEVLSISGSEKLCTSLGLDTARLVRADYPEHSLLDLRFDADTFDFVVSDQVLEHVEGDPQQAVDESLRVLKPGGVAVHTTCFMNPVHPGPKDLWRFSPEGLRLLSAGFGDIIECGGWGNRLAWPYMWIGLRFAGIPEAAWHPVHRLAVWNEPLWPIVTWVVARRAADGA